MSACLQCAKKSMDAFDYPIKSPRVFFRIIQYLFYWAWEDIIEWPWPLAPILMVLLGVGWYVDVVSALLWATFLAFLLYRWDSRILGVIAILLLVACPILLALDLQAWAEVAAVQAFFFLVMTVVLQLVELIRNPPEEGEV